MLNKKDGAVTGLLVYAIDDDANEGDNEPYSSILNSRLPAHVAAITVEEAGSLGMDFWVTMVASGVRKIVIVGPTITSDTAAVSAGASDGGVVALQQQAEILNQLLSGLGLPGDVVEVIGDALPPGDELTGLLAARFDNTPNDNDQAALNIPSASFATHNDKRATIRSAIDHMHPHLEGVPDTIDLPAASPFGQITVESQGCTLCLACVSTCPAGALTDGQSLPQLRFIEANCLQCGLCEQACPENVITLQPRYQVDSGVARQARVLNEEEPFNCVRCHKPFATRKMIDNMTSKLSDHWMFGDGQALRRLKMCEDCRVKDIFESSEEGIPVHRESSDS